MKKFGHDIIILFMLLLLTPFTATAGEGFKEQLEAQIAKDKGLNDVIVMLNNGVRFYEKKGIKIQKLDYYPDGYRFKVFIKTENGAQQPIYGRFEKSVKIPVFTHSMAKNNEVTDADIKIVKIGKSKYRNSYVSNAEELAGKFTKRRVTANRPINKTEVRNPILVKKGQRVKIQFARGNLLIEAAGIALDEGGVSDPIKVKNIDSKLILHANVKDATTVVIGGKG